jgi:cyclopropane fatty-acyl-phospholipid synthase-like methyltransferase
MNPVQADEIGSAVDFYSRHPISCEIILARLRAARGSLDGVRPEERLAHDQDHYGGLAANDRLAERAALAPGKRVADFCAGLGGPARYYAARYGVTVTGIELTPARVSGARELTRLVDLEAKVTVLHGDVMQVPLADASMDAVVSQEAFLHVPDKGRTLAEAGRILRPGGRLAFTDWFVHRPMAAEDVALMWQGMAVQPVPTLAAYKALIEGAGLRIVSVEDLTADWGPVLAERLAMYRRLREEAISAGTAAGHDAFYRSYVRLVALMQEHTLGGARFTAQK